MGPYPSPFAPEPPGGLVPANPMPSPALAPPAFVPPPAMPPSSGLSVETRPVGAPSFGQKMLPILAAFLASRGDPVMAGRSLAAYVDGKRLRRAEKLQDLDRAAEDQREAAEFQSRVFQQAQTFDEPVQFEQWKQAIAPMAQIYGVSLDGVQFSDAKRSAKAQKDAAGIISQLRSVHKEAVDDPEWQESHTTTLNGQPVKVSEVYRIANLPRVSNAQGALVGPAKKPVEVDGPPDLTRSGLDVQLADAMKRVEAGDPKAAADVKRLETAILKGDTLRRDPARGGGDRGPTDAQSFGMSERLAKAWSTANQPVKEMDRQLRIMRTGLNRFRKGDTNGGSQAVLVTFQKILDPTSVVRESEYARTTEGQALLSKIEGYATRLAKGGTTLTDPELAAMVQTAEEMLSGMSQWSAGTRQRIGAQAAKYKLDPATIFDDVLAGETPQAAPKDPAAPPSTGIGSYQDYLKTRKGKAR